MRVASIDIGTNTVLLLIADVAGDGSLVPIVDRAEITRLGQGVDRARALSADAIERTLACLSRYADEIAKSGVDRVGVVGTSAMRDAGAAPGGEKNTFIERAAEVLGVTPRVVSGRDEASLAFEGGLLGLGLEGDVVAFDVGGGSTEVIRGRHANGSAQMSELTSLDIGSVRLFERHVHADPPSPTEMAVVRAAVLDHLVGVASPPPGSLLVGMAGTVTTLAAVARGIDPYDPAKVHGMRISAREIVDVGRRLTALPVAERKRLRGLEPKRADVIPVGAAIVEALVAWARADDVIVSDRGVRWGLALALARAENFPGSRTPKTGAGSRSRA